MRLALLRGCRLFTIAMALIGPAMADEHGAAADQETSSTQITQVPADPDPDRSASAREVELGDGNRVHFRSPINVLSHLQVNIQITIGAPAPDTRWPPAAGGANSQSADEHPPAQDHQPAAPEARSAARGAGPTAARARRPQQARRRLRRLDTDGDGLLDLAELQQKLPSRRAARWLKHLDTDVDGRLSLEELSAGGGARVQRSSPGG